MNKELFEIQLIKIGKPAAWLAKQLQVDESLISKWKHSWKKIPEKYKSQISKLLKISEKDLFKEEQ